VALASSLWPSSSELFTEDFLTDSLDERQQRTRKTCWPKSKRFSGSVHSGASDLFKFRELLLEAAHSVFMRWKVLHQLRTMALTDELTSLYNRRGFLLLGMHYLRLARRTAPLSLYLADVDGLKIVNDCLRPRAGRCSARRLRRSLKKRPSANRTSLRVLAATNSPCWLRAVQANRAMRCLAACNRRSTS